MYPYIHFFGITIPTYGLCICIAVFLCAALVFRKARKVHVDSNDLLVLAAVTLGCGAVGGSVLYLLVTYGIETVWRELLRGNFAFFKNQGLVFYGGLVAGLLSGIITMKCLKMKVEDVEMCAVPYIPLGHAIGRIGCLLAGCCFGAPYAGPFAVETPFAAGRYFPIQGVEAAGNLVLFAILLWYTGKKREKYDVLSLYVILYACLRFLLEFFRGDAARGSFLMFSTSQWVSFLLLMAAVLYKTIKKKR